MKVDFVGDILPFLVGVIIGLVILFFVVKKLRKNKIEKIEKEITDIKNNRFKELLDNKANIENLVASELKKWFEENLTDVKTEVEIFIAFPTSKLLESLGYNVTETVDEKKHILQCIFEKESSKVVAIRLINFINIDSQLETRLLEANGLLVVEQ